MTPSLSIAIMHHPKRAERIPPLVASIGEGAPVTVVEDTNSDGNWPTAKRAWAAYPESATHHAVIQDDVLVCADFIATLQHLIRILPNHCIGLYCPRKVADTAANRGHSWALLRYGVWGQGFLMPTSWFRACLDWNAANLTEQVFIGDDTRVGYWLQAANTPTWLTVPSLIEHDAPSDSLLGYGNSRRVARRFIGTEGRGLERNWHLGLVDPASDTSPHAVPDEFLKRPGE